MAVKGRYKHGTPSPRSPRALRENIKFKKKKGKAQKCVSHAICIRRGEKKTCESSPGNFSKEKYNTDYVVNNMKFKPRSSETTDLTLSLIP